MDATITTATRPNPPLLGVLAGLLAGARRPVRAARLCPAGLAGTPPVDRDQERLLADLRALRGAPADLNHRRVRV
jgi:hypothetical protein